MITTDTNTSYKEAYMGVEFGIMRGTTALSQGGSNM